MSVQLPQPVVLHRTPHVELGGVRYWQLTQKRTAGNTMIEYPELTFQEKRKIYNKMRGKDLEMIDESIKKLDNQFWEYMKIEQYEKADKTAKINLYIKSIIKTLAASF